MASTFVKLFPTNALNCTTVDGFSRSIILSPRVVHLFDEVTWECAEVTRCECGRFPIFEHRYPVDLNEIFQSTAAHIINSFIDKSAKSVSRIASSTLLRNILAERSHSTAISFLLSPA
jgi:hypothetical protein